MGGLTKTNITYKFVMFNFPYIISYILYKEPTRCNFGSIVY